MNSPLPRRAVLAGALLLGVTGCTIPGPPPERSQATTIPERATETPPVPGRGRVLLAYFSRAGENYFYGGRRDLGIGNTEVLASMITELINCDVHRIEASAPYPNGYDDTVQRNVAEQDSDARPAIADPLGSIDDYEHVLLGSPIWNTRPPMIMSTFAESYDFTGRRSTRSSPTPSAASAAPNASTPKRAKAHRSPPGSRYAARRSPNIVGKSRHGSARPASLPNITRSVSRLAPRDHGISNLGLIVLSAPRSA